MIIIISLESSREEEKGCSTSGEQSLKFNPKADLSDPSSLENATHTHIFIS